MTKTCSPLIDLQQDKQFPMEFAALLKDQREGQSLQQHARPASGKNLQGVCFEYRIAPALYLSGDALDYFQLPDGRLLAYLLDVSGHGTAAALLSMFIKSSVRYSLTMQPQATAAGVLADVNAALLEADMQKYATMLCMIFSPQDNRLDWAHAGHTPRPVLWSARQARLLEARGQPVGLFAGAEFPGQQLELPPAFSLVLCSDGILDALPGDDFVSREAALVSLVATSEGRFADVSGTLIDAQGPSCVDDRSVFVISRASP